MWVMLLVFVLIQILLSNLLWYEIRYTNLKYRMYKILNIDVYFIYII